LFRSRNAGFSCYNVTTLPENCAPPFCLPLDIKDSLKEDSRLLDEGRLFDGGVFWLKRIAGGRLLEGENELLKGKELMKGNC
jgi:hypothetical protein